MSHVYKRAIFDSPEFKQLEKSFNLAMADADKAPNVPCPVCGNDMTKELGDGRLAGYECRGGNCVGFHVSVGDLLNADNWRTLVADAAQRKQAYEEMRARNKTHGFSAERQSGEFYCADCDGYHAPSKEHPLCPFDKFVLHAPMPPDLYFDYRGWRFTPPFICMCCGIEVCFRQWAFSRSCGVCDVSNSKTRRVLVGKCFSGPHEKLSTWNADKHDIPEKHFLNPKDADRYPRLPISKYRGRPNA